MTNSIRVNLYGKPSERLIFIGLCETLDCTFTYDETTGLMFARGKDAFALRDQYEEIINTAYKALAFAQADHKLDNIPNKTLVSEFMHAYATIAYSMITGKTVKWSAKTEAQRAGIKAIMKKENING
jgi:hypothetical protein